MLKFSKILLLLYVILLLVFIWKKYLLTPLILLLLLISFTSILITLVKLITTFNLRDKRNTNILTTIFLLVPIIVLISSKAYQNQKKIKLSAYSDLVISSADITFYENNKMRYCTSTLFGESYFYGKFEILNDTFLVNYNHEVPAFDSKKMIRLGNKLLFLGEDNTAASNFNVDFEFRVEQNNTIR